MRRSKACLGVGQAWSRTLPTTTARRADVDSEWRQSLGWARLAGRCQTALEACRSEQVRDSRDNETGDGEIATFGTYRELRGWASVRETVLLSYLGQAAVPDAP